MIEVLAPRPFDALRSPKRFLVETINNGQAEPWQADVAQELADLDVAILNPRRDRWEALADSARRGGLTRVDALANTTSSAATMHARFGIPL